MGDSMNEDDDEGGIGIKVHGKGLVVSSVIALFLAPIIPGFFAGILLCLSIFVAMVVGVSYWLVRNTLLDRYVEGQDFNNSQGVLMSDEAAELFEVLGGTVLIGVTALAWLGAAGLLWQLDSFFVLLAASHCTYTTVYVINSIGAFKEDLDLVDPEEESDESV